MPRDRAQGRYIGSRCGANCELLLANFVYFVLLSPFLLFYFEHQTVAHVLAALPARYPYSGQSASTILILFLLFNGFFCSIYTICAGQFQRSTVGTGGCVAQLAPTGSLLTVIGWICGAPFRSMGAPYGSMRAPYPLFIP